jgi:hypothetical protein
MGEQPLKLQALTCLGISTLNFLNALVFLTNAITAKTITNTQRETVIGPKLKPIDVKPKNKPTNPVKPKLSATDNTNCSTKSILFLPKNKAFTRLYPGKNATKTKLKRYLGINRTEKSGLLGIK